MHGPCAWRRAALAWAVVVVAFALIPLQAVLDATVPEHETAVTRAGHFFEFALLAFLLAVAFDGWAVNRRSVVGAAVVAIGMGVLIELVQGPLPYRDCQLSDALTDVAGVALGLVVFSVVARAPGRRSRWRRG